MKDKIVDEGKKQNIKEEVKDSNSWTQYKAKLEEERKIQRVVDTSSFV